MTALPTNIEDYFQMAITNVTKAIGVEPDLTPETLPLIDAYLKQARPIERPEVRSLIISTVGVYFGEVMRRLLDGWWTMDGASPTQWRIELRPCYLHFQPVGMTGEVLLGRESDQFDGTFGILEEVKDELETMLKMVGPVSEEEYYSLCGRCDSLQMVSEWLLARGQRDNHPIIPLAADDYLNSNQRR